MNILCCAAELRALLMGLSVGKSNSGGLEEDISYWMSRFDHDDSGAASFRGLGWHKHVGRRQPQSWTLSSAPGMQCSPAAWSRDRLQGSDHKYSSMPPSRGFDCTSNHGPGPAHPVRLCCRASLWLPKLLAGRPCTWSRASCAVPHMSEAPREQACLSRPRAAMASTTSSRVRSAADCEAGRARDRLLCSWQQCAHSPQLGLKELCCAGTIQYSEFEAELSR